MARGRAPPVRGIVEKGGTKEKGGVRAAKKGGGAVDFFYEIHLFICFIEKKVKVYVGFKFDVLSREE